MHSNFHYNKNLKPFARRLRNHPTKGEEMLWYQVLRNRGMMGYRFLRQRSILNYIVDFFCKELNLIIEVDGITHEDKKDQDRIRDQKLKQVGYFILRIEDGYTFSDLDGVIREIEYTIEQIKVETKNARD